MKCVASICPGALIVSFLIKFTGGLARPHQLLEISARVLRKWRLAAVAMQ